MASALALIEARARFGTQAGTRVWQAFRSATPNRGISNALLVSGAHSAVTAPIMQS